MKQNVYCYDNCIVKKKSCYTDIITHGKGISGIWRIWLSSASRLSCDSGEIIKRDGWCNYGNACTETELKNRAAAQQKEEWVRASGGSLVSHWSAGGSRKASELRRFNCIRAELFCHHFSVQTWISCYCNINYHDINWYHHVLIETFTGITVIYHFITRKVSRGSVIT